MDFSTALRLVVTVTFDALFKSLRMSKCDRSHSEFCNSDPSPPPVLFKLPLSVFVPH